MRPFLSTPAPWLALLSVLASAGLWVWTQRIPPSVWETTSPLTANAPTAAPTAPGNASTPEEPPATTVFASPTPSSAPTPATHTTAAASPAAVPATPPSPSPTPRPPSDAELAGPLPQHSRGESAAPALGTGPSVPIPPPSDTAVATNAPTVAPVATHPLLPAPLDLASLAQQPERWPRQVLLLAPVRFPVILKGVNAGTIQAPAGSPVLLRKINPDGSVEIELPPPSPPGSIAKVKAQLTDLLARARATAAAQANPTPPVHPVP